VKEVTLQDIALPNAICSVGSDSVWLYGTWHCAVQCTGFTV